jgi:cytochrome P450
MQIKLVMFEMLRRYRWTVPDTYRMPVQQSPISKPRDGLPIYLDALPPRALPARS